MTAVCYLQFFIGYISEWLTPPRRIPGDLHKLVSLAPDNETYVVLFKYSQELIAGKPSVHDEH